MKLFTSNCRRHQQIVSKKRYKRKKNRIKTKIYQNILPRRITKTIVAPESFSLRSNAYRQNLMSFINDIEHKLKSGFSVKVSFIKTKHLVPCGTLLFAARLVNMLLLYPGKITSNYPKDKVVEQLFQHIGLLGLLGNSSRQSITDDSVRYWHFLSGTTADAEIFKDLFREYKQKLKEDVTSGLYEGMSEAITNSIQHAYSNANEHERLHKTKWWMFSQEKDGKLSVVICDLGIGIPKSLKMKLSENILYLTRRNVDSKLIADAVKSNRTSTNLGYRGKGLPDMLDFVKNFKVGGFSIYSLHGSYIYNAETEKESTEYYKIQVPGTLIQWQIPLA